jgi:hypothetical protein
VIGAALKDMKVTLVRNITFAISQLLHQQVLLKPEVQVYFEQESQ